METSSQLMERVKLRNAHGNTTKRLTHLATL